MKIAIDQELGNRERARGQGAMLAHLRSAAREGRSAIAAPGAHRAYERSGAALLPRRWSSSLDGVEIVVAGSAGDGFVRHMKNRGAEVLLTGETDPAAALTRIIAGEPLPEQGFDITTTLCKLRDMFATLIFSLLYQTPPI